MLVLTKLRKYIYECRDHITFIYNDDDGNLDRTITSINTNDVGFMIDYGYRMDGSPWGKTRIYKNKNIQLSIQTRIFDRYYLNISIFRLTNKLINIMICPDDDCEVKFECNDLALLNKLLGLDSKK